VTSHSHCSYSGWRKSSEATSEVLDMPAGQPITTDRFSELEVLGVLVKQSLRKTQNVRLQLVKKPWSLPRVKQIFCTYGLP